MPLIADYLDRMILNTILVPIDASPEADQAARAAVWFARDNVCKVAVLAIAPNEGTEAGSLERMRELHHQASLIAELASGARVPCETTVLCSRRATDDILAAAARMHCDLIWLPPIGATSDPTLLSRLVMLELLDQTSIPVMCFPARPPA